MILFLRDLAFKDFWLKLFSLALAVLIWATVKINIRKEEAPPAAPAAVTTNLTTHNNP